MDDFSAKWPKFSDLERVEFCRQAARQAEAEAEASNADPCCRQEYLNIAVQWRLLAIEIERNHGPSKEASSTISH